jgi:ABC-type iron transport system FetAB ATPase subunit
MFTDHKNYTFNGLKASHLVLRTCWLLLLEEYGLTFEYIQGKKNVGSCCGCLFHIDIDRDSRRKSINTFSGSENKSISNIKSTIPIHTSLIFREQSKVKDTRSREKVSRLIIDNLKIQEEKVLALLSVTENSIISNIKSTITMHTALIFKEQAKVKDTRSRERT